MGSREPSERWERGAPSWWRLDLPLGGQFVVWLTGSGRFAFDGRAYDTLVEAQLAAEDHARHHIHEALRALGDTSHE